MRSRRDVNPIADSNRSCDGGDTYDGEDLAMHATSDDGRQDDGREDPQDDVPLGGSEPTERELQADIAVEEDTLKALEEEAPSG